MNRVKNSWKSPNTTLNLIELLRREHNLSHERPISILLSNLLRSPNINEYIHAYVLREESLESLLNKLFKSKEPKWYDIVFPLGKVKGKIKTYSLQPPRIKEIDGKQFIYTYSKATMKLIDVKRFYLLLSKLPDEIRLKIANIPVEVITEMLFLVSKNKVLVIIPNTSLSSIEEYVKPFLKKTGIVIEKSFEVPSSEDFLYWLLIRAKAKRTIKVKHTVYKIELIRKVLGNSPSKIHQVSGRRIKVPVTDDQVTDWIIYNQEVISDLDIIIKVGNETLPLTLALRGNILLFRIKPGFSEIIAPNRLIKRIIILHKLFTGILPDLREAYKKDKKWNKVRKLIAEKASRETFERFKKDLVHIYELASKYS